MIKEITRGIISILFFSVTLDWYSVLEGTEKISTPNYHNYEIPQTIWE